MLEFVLKPQREVGRRVDLFLSAEQNSLIDFKIWPCSQSEQGCFLSVTFVSTMSDMACLREIESDGLIPAGPFGSVRKPPQ